MLSWGQNRPKSPSPAAAHHACAWAVVSLGCPKNEGCDSWFEGPSTKNSNSTKNDEIEMLNLLMIICINIMTCCHFVFYQS